MALNKEDTYKLVRKIEERKAPQKFFASRFFPTVMTFSDEEIHFDFVSKNRRLAPFVSPLVAGKVMSSRGHTMKSFRPAYVKPKHVVDPKKATKRRAGEAFGGSMDPAQRYELAKQEGFVEQAEMIDNRIELMCVEAMKTGTITVTGEDYPTQVVDFGRDAGLTVTLTLTDRWSDLDDSTPYEDIEDMATNMAKAPHGAAPRDIIMDPDAWKALRKHPTTEKHLDKNFQGQNTNMDRGPMVFGDEVQAVATLGGGRFTIWVDSRDYEDEAGDIVPFLASGEVVFGSINTEGVQAFGAILDVDWMENDGRVESTIFPKYYKQNDPSVGYVLTQSAPLPIPVRINATGFMQVL